MRRNRSLRPALERFEEEHLLSAGPPMSPAHPVDARAGRAILPAEGRSRPRYRLPATAICESQSAGTSSSPERRG